MAISLPPGLQFYPTDEELVVHFLRPKAKFLSSNLDVIPDLDLNLYDPWELNGKALEGDNQWYFFSLKAHNGSILSPNGYWKPTGDDEPIKSASKKVGLKKSLVFYIGEAPMEIKTNWVMQQYHLSDCGATNKSSKRMGKLKSALNDEEWVLCRVHDMNINDTQSSSCEDEDDEGIELSYLDEIFLTLDDLDEVSSPN
eukprot:TRINITY_DN10321_c0_g1_i1.p1 TRINITY_DN10321_c0_g1~~TRINITY_DN10321_c0_g1_i1.p1  ORF type:complete len:198 (+),score=31.82 TRINITY_DN10321_c0_g1_i1:170-763(+)